jgi:4-hydroxy-tetrahydrodipicolinate synthase
MKSSAWWRTAGVKPAAWQARIATVWHSVPGLPTIQSACRASPTGFAILGGDDAFISPLLALGGHGGILASAHLATADFAELIARWNAGDAAPARVLGGRLAALSTALFAEPNPTVIKAVLHERGRIPTAAVRLPLLPAGRDSTAAASRLCQDSRPGR